MCTTFEVVRRECRTCLLSVIMCATFEVVRRDGGDGDDSRTGEMGEAEEIGGVLRDEEMRTLMTTPSPWQLPAASEAGYEADMSSDTDDDLRMGYLQISDHPTSLPSIASLEDQVEDLNTSTSSSPENGGVTIGQNGGHAGSLAGAVVSNGRNPMERIVTVNGMQFHVYGNVSGLELLGGDVHQQTEDIQIPDTEEEEEEERRRAAEERAIAVANAADAARRAAPIPPEHCSRIVDAMKSITLGGFRPSWADFVPEDEWMNEITQSGRSLNPRTSGCTN